MERFALQHARLGQWLSRTAADDFLQFDQQSKRWVPQAQLQAFTNAKSGNSWPLGHEHHTCRYTKQARRLEPSKEMRWCCAGWLRKTRGLLRPGHHVSSQHCGIPASRILLWLSIVAQHLRWKAIGEWLGTTFCM